MPRLSVWFIRASLIYLFIGFSLGAWLLANNGLNFAPSAWGVLPSHIETLLIGWIIQLALGTAYWILPRHTKGLPRGSPAWGWLAFWVINLGLLLAASTGLLPAGFQAAGRGLEILGAGVIVVLLWPRVKSYGV